MNPTKDYGNFLKQVAENLLKISDLSFVTNTDVTRGLDYYKDGKGFEIEVEELGSQKQICGGGAYENGVGFALGIDRILEINNDKFNK